MPAEMLEYERARQEYVDAGMALHAVIERRGGSLEREWRGSGGGTGGGCRGNGGGRGGSGWWGEGKGGRDAPCDEARCPPALSSPICEHA